MSSIRERITPYLEEAGSETPGHVNLRIDPDDDKKNRRDRQTCNWWLACVKIVVAVLLGLTVFSRKASLIRESSSTPQSVPAAPEPRARLIHVRNSSSVEPVHIDLIAPRIPVPPQLEGLARRLARFANNMSWNLEDYANDSMCIAQNAHSLFNPTLTTLLPRTSAEESVDDYRNHLATLIHQDDAIDKVTVIVRTGPLFDNWRRICLPILLTCSVVHLPVLVYSWSPSISIPLNDSNVQYLDVSSAQYYTSITYSVLLSANLVKTKWILRIDEDRCVEACTQLERATATVRRSPTKMAAAPEVIRGFDIPKDEQCYTTSYERKVGKQIPAIGLATNGLYSRIWMQVAKDVLPFKLLRAIDYVHNGEDLILAWFMAFMNKDHSQFELGSDCFSGFPQQMYPGLACSGCYSEVVEKLNLTHPRQIHDKVDHTPDRTKVTRLLFTMYSHAHFAPRSCGKYPW